MSEFTPGPWEAWPETQDHPAMVVQTRNPNETRKARLVNIIAGLNSGAGDPQEHTANAYLIAASPDLYGACDSAETVLSLAADDCNDTGPSGQRCGECLGCLINAALGKLRNAMRKAAGRKVPA